jgi:uncharacterized cupredoxin-like copper-binding protein
LNRLISAIAAFAVIGTASTLAAAHGDAHQDKTPMAGAKAISAEEHSFGRQGDPARVSRTVTVDMSDAMRFSPSEIKVKQGETIRFVAKNGGNVLHEMVLGNMAELKAHGELMKKFPNMEHDEPYMAHVAPGKAREIVWTFTKAGEFHFGCLVPGHFDAGMVGRVIVSKS